MHFLRRRLGDQLRVHFFAIILLTLVFNAYAQWNEESINIRNRFRAEEIRQKMNAAKQPLTTNGEQDNFDAGYYALDLRISFNPDEIFGTVSGEYTSKTHGLTQIVLDFDRNMAIDSIYGNVASWTHTDFRLTVVLDRTYNAGEHFSIVVSYHGKPRVTGDNYFVFTNSGDGSRTAWSLSEPYGARTWWPCKDTPSDKADSADIRITVTQRFKAISNGRLISVTTNPDQTKTWHWHESFPITTYLISVAVADYAHFTDSYSGVNGDSLLLDYYVYPSQLATAQNTFAEMPQYLEAFEHFFGPYPFPGEKYGMAQFTWPGGMEHQTITSIGGVNSNWRFAFIHELGHQWFGDQVTCASWQDIWLNEGFASYSEALFEEYAKGEKAYHDYMDSQLYKGDGTVFIEDTSRVGNVFSRIVYDKGSWVLHMLRHVLGDSTFFEILKTWAQQAPQTYATAKTEDFVEHCELISGNQLDVFFEQWIYRPGFPHYEYSWQWQNSIEGIELQIDVSQIQQESVFEMPLDITVFGEGRDTTFTVENIQREQSFFVYLPFEPIKVVLDREDWILKNVTPVTPGGTSPNDFELYQNYPNPFNAGTKFRWFAPVKGSAYLQIFNINGELVYSKIVGNPDGRIVVFDWDGRDEGGREVASGIYVLRADFTNFWGENYSSAERKLIRIK